MKGWFKVYRSITDWEWFKKEHYLKLYLYLYAKANEDDHIWRGINIQHNQVVTSLKSITRDTGISEQSVRTCLCNLEKSGYLTRKVTQGLTHKVTIITLDEKAICEVSGGRTNTRSNTETNTKLTRNQHETNTPSTHAKEYNNNFNIYNNKNNYLDRQQRGGAPARVRAWNSGTDGQELSPLDKNREYQRKWRENHEKAISYDEYQKTKNQS